MLCVVEASVRKQTYRCLNYAQHDKKKSNHHQQIQNNHSYPHPQTLHHYLSTANV